MIQEPFGLLEGLPAKVLEKAREWERHVVEVETGLPPNPLPGASPRAGFDPPSTTIAARDRVKTAELGVSLRTIKVRRARYAQQGLWGLVDQRAARWPARILHLGEDRGLTRRARWASAASACSAACGSAGLGRGTG